MTSKHDAHNLTNCLSFTSNNMLCALPWPLHAHPCVCVSHQVVCAVVSRVPCTVFFFVFFWILCRTEQWVNTLTWSAGGWLPGPYVYIWLQWCVCLRERECERECMCVSERERVCMCVWERECVCVCATSFRNGIWLKTNYTSIFVWLVDCLISCVFSRMMLSVSPTCWTLFSFFVMPSLKTWPVVQTND